jgi:hypothetical protein
MYVIAAESRDYQKGAGSRVSLIENPGRYSRVALGRAGHEGAPTSPVPLSAGEAMDPAGRAVPHLAARLARVRLVPPAPPSTPPRGSPRIPPPSAPPRTWPRGSRGTLPASSPTGGGGYAWAGGVADVDASTTSTPNVAGNEGTGSECEMTMVYTPSVPERVLLEKRVCLINTLPG